MSNEEEKNKKKRLVIFILLLLFTSCLSVYAITTVVRHKNEEKNSEPVSNKVSNKVDKNDKEVAGSKEPNTNQNSNTTDEPSSNDNEDELEDDTDSNDEEEVEPPTSNVASNNTSNKTSNVTNNKVSNNTSNKPQQPVIKKYDVSIISKHGTLSKDKETLEENKKFETSVEVEEGYELENIECTNNQIVEMDEEGNITIEKVTNNTVCTINYKANKYSLTINPNGGTYNDLEEVTELYIEYMSEFVLSVPKKLGYIFQEWYIDGNGTIIEDNNLLMGFNTIIKALWTVETFDINLSVENGTSDYQKLIVEYDNDGTFVVTPNEGYAYIEKNGSSFSCENSENVTYQKNDNKLLIKNVKNNDQCTIKFVENKVEIVTPDEANSGMYKYGDKYTIVVNSETLETHDFYVIGSTEKMVSLIMDDIYTENNSATVKYGTSTIYPTESLLALPKVTQWTNIPSPGYFEDVSAYNDTRIDYNPYAARNITYGELNAGCVGGTCPAWLKGPRKEFWTSSSKYTSGNSMSMAYMSEYGSVSTRDYSSKAYVRPVIDVPKTFFNDNFGLPVVENIVEPVEILSNNAFSFGDKYEITVNSETNEKHNFYVLSSDEKTVTLIMDQNYTENNSAEVIYGTSSTYPTTAVRILPTVDQWPNIPSPGNIIDESANYDTMINYEPYAARNVTYGEINGACKGKCPAWIKGNYWTSSSRKVSGSTMSMWVMDSWGISSKDYSQKTYVRPVITLSKKYFKGIINEKAPENIVSAVNILSNNKYSFGDEYQIIVNSETDETHNFFVLNSDEKTVTLIMDDNYLENKNEEVIYGSSGTVPTTSFDALPEVSQWPNITSPGNLKDISAYYDTTINYLKKAARFPTYGELSTACNGTNGCPTWLKGRYWTSSSKQESGTTMRMWYIDAWGTRAYMSSQNYSDKAYVRPVIKISKDYFKDIIDESKNLDIITPVEVESNDKFTFGDKYEITVNSETNESHTFYVIGSDEKTVKLLMSENYTTNAPDGVKFGTARSKPSYIFPALPTVAQWPNIPTPGVFNDITSAENITIDYSPYAARVPSYGEIYAASYGSTLPTWMRGEYWTSSGAVTSGSVMNVYYVKNGYIGYNEYSQSGNFRPVIVLSKDMFTNISSSSEKIGKAVEQTTKGKIAYGDKFEIVVNKNTNEKHNFYVLSSTVDTVTLLMETNYEGTSSDTVIFGTSRSKPTNAITILPTAKNWNNIKSIGEYYDAASEDKITINYSNYAARLVSYGEISSACLDRCPTWLRANGKEYWTSTGKKVSGSIMEVYYVTNYSISYQQYNNKAYVRPVITVDKKLLNY